MLELQSGYWFEVKYQKHLKGETIYVALTGPVLRDRDSLEKIFSRQIGHKGLKSVRAILMAPSEKRANLRNPLVLYGENQYGGVQEFYVSSKFRNLLDAKL
jgi:hypothetical protein